MTICSRVCPFIKRATKFFPYVFLLYLAALNISFSDSIGNVYTTWFIGQYVFKVAD